MIAVGKQCEDFDFVYKTFEAFSDPYLDDGSFSDSSRPKKIWI